MSSSLKVDKIGLVFDGTTSSLQLPLSVSAGKKVWTISTTLTTNQNTSSQYNYHQPCLIGIDTADYNSDDFHIDTCNGNLYLFNGMGDVYKDIGTDTGIKINDEIQHNIVLTSDGSKLTLYCDGKKVTESAITKALDGANPITIGCSKPGECVYSQLTLYDFKFYDICLTDGKATTEKPIVDYEPDTVDFSNKYLTDKSGNGNNSQAFSGTITSIDAKDNTSTSTLNIDISRKVSNADYNCYRWETAGDGSQFDVHESFITSKDVKYSKTGIAFNASDNSTLQKNLPNLNEVWLKFDYFNGTYYRWVQVFFNDDKNIGMHGTDDDTFFNFFGHEFSGIDGINTVLMHISKTTNTAELWINGTKVISGISANLTAPITKVSMSPSGYGSDYSWRTNNWMSNVIISDKEIGLDEIAKGNTPLVTINADIARKVSAELVNVYDISRTLKDNTIAVTLNIDTFVKTNIDEIANYDVARTIQDSILYINQGDGTSLGLTSDCNYTGKIYNPINETAFSTKSKEITVPLVKNQKQLYISFGVRPINKNYDDCVRVYINNSQNKPTGIKFVDGDYHLFIENNEKKSGKINTLNYHQVYMEFNIEPKTAKYYIDNVLVYSGTNVTFSATDLASDGLYIKTDADDTISNIIVSTKELTPDTCLISNQITKIYQPVLTAAPSKSDDFYIETNCECTDSNSENVPSTDVWKYINHSTEQGKIKLKDGNYIKFTLKNKAIFSGIYFNGVPLASNDNPTAELMYSDDDINYKSAGTWETQQDNSSEKIKSILPTEENYHKYWKVVSSCTSIVSGNTSIDASITAENIGLIMITEPIPVLINANTHRYVIDGNTALVLTDIQKITNVDIDAGIDLSHQIVYNADLSVDTQRITSNCFTTTEDIVRNVVYGAKLEVDTQRSKYLATVDNADTRISIPSVITDQSSGLQSVSISMGQSQLSDSIRIVTINPVDINGAVIGNFLDYKLNMRAETTSQKGILQEITCMTDKDEMLYKKIVYTGDADAKIYHGKEIYNEDVKNQSEILSYMKLSKHMQKIANVIGCNLVMCSDDYISTCSLNDSGATYQSIISELCGWTSKLPNMFINAFLRGNTLYIIQRGHEPNSINIDNLKMTEPTIAKKLVRTEWNNAQSTSGGGNGAGTIGAHFPDDEKDDGDGSDVDKQEPRVETSSDTRYSDDGGYSVTETQRTYAEIGALHGAVMISHETETCTAYSAENLASTSVDSGVEVYRGASRDITVTLTETYHNYDSYGWHTVTTTTTVNGILKETHTSKSLGSTEGVTPFRVHAVIDAKKDTTTINSGDDVNNYNSLVDSDFPVYGDYLTTCKSNIKWLNRKVQETVTLSIYDYTHIFDFQDKIVYKGNTYSIQSSSFEKNSTIVNKQDLVLIRFY